VNADGFDPSRGHVFRSAQNVQALTNSTTPQDPSFGIDFSTNGRNPIRLSGSAGVTTARRSATSPSSPSRSHAPKTLFRTRGVDFRLPTDEELDALTAYQLALGRQEDFNLPTLTLNSPLASHGKTLYLDSGDLFEPGHKNSNGCHFNGGGTAGMSFNSDTPGFPKIDGSPRGFNIGAGTNVNETPKALALNLPRRWRLRPDPDAFWVLRKHRRPAGRPSDTSSSRNSTARRWWSRPTRARSFTTTLWQTWSRRSRSMARRHSKTASRNGATPVTISGDPADSEVQAIGAFLRVLNALENIRSSINVAERGRRLIDAADMRDAARLSLAEVVDAMEVLSAGALSSRDDPAVRTARVRLTVAQAALGAAERLKVAGAIENLLSVALRDLRAAREALAEPTTLPASFQN
jgi:hypothetical protein